MWSWAETARVRAYGFFRPVAAALALSALAAGCGFQPAGRTPLPAAMRTTCVTGPQPYGNLENLLRGALARDGVTVVDGCAGASATLQIVNERSTNRVLVVDASGRPAEYALDYVVKFQLLDEAGRTLLAPQTLRLSRDYAYSVTNVLGVGIEQTDILSQMQQTATRLIVFRLQALGRSPDVTSAAGS